MEISGHDDFRVKPKRHSVKYGFVYLWYDRKHKRYYVGCHWGKEDDPYICSSRWMKASYKRRPNDFKRRILKRVFTNKHDLLEAEYHYLQMIKPAELRKRYYNISNHRFNHWSIKSSKSMSKKMSDAAKKLWGTPGVREQKRQFLKDRWNDPEYRLKMMTLQSEKSIRQKETFKRIGHMKGAKNHFRGKVWVTNGQVDTHALPDEIPEGYWVGRTNANQIKTYPPKEFVKLLEQNLMGKEIASILGVSPATVSNWSKKITKSS